MEENFSEKLQQLLQRFSSENQKFETELKNSDEKLSKFEIDLKNNSQKLSTFEGSIKERQNSLETNFSEKLQQSDDKISLLSADTQKGLAVKVAV